MRLALRRRSEPTPAPPVEPESFEQTSIALEHVIERLEDAPRPGVLDLGAPIASNVSLYARHGARITFADLYRFYAPVRAQTTSARTFTALLPDTAFHIDIIFAWDLLNYLSLEEIGWLGDAIREKCAPGAILFALVSCPGPMPTTPSFHTIAGRDTLVVAMKTSDATTFPGYSEQTLLRALPDLTVKSRFQLRNSMVEYLFTWE